jgi:hypothetical protein
MKRIAFAMILGASLSGCIIQKGTHIRTGEVLPATKADQVKIYMTPPAKYKVVGQVTGEGSHAFVSKQALVDAALVRAKKEAAKLGANGILLQNVADKAANSIGMVNMNTTGNLSTGMFVGGGITDKAVTALAIVVEKE